MHSTLTEHARCLYGDEHRPAPECDLDHHERHFAEELAFADADAILTMLHALCPTSSTATRPSGSATSPTDRRRRNAPTTRP
ncbi:hypothetical protein [Streptomyces sp. NPDC014676]|uniref:hypothetical protein n=1 Tax=Streptomyces sp. NPDC014676 TaxID=3364879 RepID=UPI0036F8C4CE